MFTFSFCQIFSFFFLSGVYRQQLRPIHLLLHGDFSFFSFLFLCLASVGVCAISGWIFFSLFFFIFFCFCRIGLSCCRQTPNKENEKEKRKISPWRRRWIGLFYYTREAPSTVIVVLILLLFFSFFFFFFLFFFVWRLDGNISDESISPPPPRCFCFPSLLGG